MSGKNAREISDEKLDRLATEVVRAAAARGDGQAGAVAASPFLYTRVAARIEERRRAQGEDGWRAALAVAWRAVPAMALVAALAAALLLWVGLSGATQSQSPAGFEAISDTRGTGVVTDVLSDTGSLSREEVLQIVISRDETESHK
jgi:hypothetical protein